MIWSRFATIAVVSLFLAACGGRNAPAPVEYADSSIASQTAIVNEGDSYYLIAKRYEVDLRALLDINSAQPPYTIFAGQRLRLPEPKEYRVFAGDTLYSISRQFSVSMSDLARINGMGPPYTIQEGQVLRLPYGSQGTEAVGVVSTTPEQKANSSSLSKSTQKTVVQTQLDSPEPKVASEPKPVSSKPLSPVLTAAPQQRSGSGFLWPVEGKIISRYGPKNDGLHNDGINIAVAPNAPVKASENGIVAYAGNELRGYGNLLILRHANGYMTAYAHNNRLKVKRGDQVRRGQVIAEAGSSGSVDRTQVHFEIRKGSIALDPVKYLNRS